MSFEQVLAENPRRIDSIAGLRTGNEIWMPLNSTEKTIEIAWHEAGHIIGDRGLFESNVISPTQVKQLKLDIPFVDKVTLLSQLWSPDFRTTSDLVKHTIQTILSKFVRDHDINSIIFHYDISTDEFHKKVKSVANTILSTEERELLAFNTQFACLRILCNTINPAGVALYRPPKIRYSLENAADPHARAQKIAWERYFGIT